MISHRRERAKEEEEEEEKIIKILGAKLHSNALQSMENSRSRMSSSRIVGSALQRAKIGPRLARQLPTHAYEMRLGPPRDSRDPREPKWRGKEGSAWV